MFGQVKLSQREQMKTKIQNVSFSAWSAKLENPATACTKQAPKSWSVAQGQMCKKKAKQQNKESESSARLSISFHRRNAVLHSFNESQTSLTLCMKLHQGPCLFDQGPGTLHGTHRVKYCRYAEQARCFLSQSNIKSYRTAYSANLCDKPSHLSVTAQAWQP